MPEGPGDNQLEGEDQRIGGDEPVEPAVAAEPGEPAVPGESAESAESAEPGEPAVPPRMDRRLFRRELMPAWINAVAALRSNPIQRLGRPDLHIAYLGSGHTVTAAVAAAVHPQSTVWLWDHRPSAVEFTAALADAAGLNNLRVHEHPELPARLGATDPWRPVDLVVVDHVLDAFGAEGRAKVIDSIEESLRPGGAVVVSHRTAIGWAEIDPLVRLLRYMVTTNGGPLTQATEAAVAWLTRLRDTNAVYIQARPVVGEWLNELANTPTAQIIADYLDLDLQPISHVQVSDALGSIGCHLVGSATFGDETAMSGPEAPITNELFGAVNAAATVELRETFMDLALRRTHRSDIYRLGHSRGSQLGVSLSIAPFDPQNHGLLEGADEMQLATLMHNGVIHPAAPAPVAATPVAATPLATSTSNESTSESTADISSSSSASVASSSSPTSRTDQAGPAQQLSAVLASLATPDNPPLVVLPQFMTAIEGASQ